MRRAALFCVLLTLAACGNETLTGYGTGTYVLEGIDGAAFAARATLSLEEPGRVFGETPCNSYTGALESPYPWFEPGPLAVTQRACIDGAAETQFLAALSEMTLAEVSGPVLLLTDDEGARTMTFRRED
ncbi:MAG: META domain-containing protein [Pseudomonadota bacterium]